MSWTHPAYEAVIRLLGARTGLAFGPGRYESAELGIRRAMARRGVGDLQRYRLVLETDQEAFDQLVVELTVGETYFFREPAQFEFVRTEVVPEVRRRRGPGHVVRAWSAGCASGEEAYSLAILFEEEGLGGQAHLLGTDISREALARARQGVYGSWSLRGESAALATRYLSPQGNRYVLEERLRRRVTFEHLNLALDTYPSFATGTWGMDLILCRNVLIYFDPDTVRQVARRLFDALVAGGWLLTASSDPPLGEFAPYETVVTDRGVFYHRGEARAVTVATALPASVTAQAADVGFTTASAEAAGKRSHGEAGRPTVFEESESAGVSHPPAAAKEPAITEEPSPGPAQADPLAEAREAFNRGDYARAAAVTGGTEADAAAWALRVRALANLEAGEAERACAEATARHPLSAELHYLRAVLLLELDRDEEAAQAIRRLLYLDRSLAIAHFTLGSILRRRGDLAGARRAYRNARKICAARPADEIVPLSDGEHAGRLAEAAAAEIALLTASGEPAA